MTPLWDQGYRDWAAKLEPEREINRRKVPQLEQNTRIVLLAIYAIPFEGADWGHSIWRGWSGSFHLEGLVGVIPFGGVGRGQLFWFGADIASRSQST